MPRSPRYLSNTLAPSDTPTIPLGARGKRRSSQSCTRATSLVAPAWYRVAGAVHLSAARAEVHPHRADTVYGKLAIVQRVVPSSVALEPMQQQHQRRIVRQRSADHAGDVQVEKVAVGRVDALAREKYAAAAAQCGTGHGLSVAIGEARGWAIGFERKPAIAPRPASGWVHCQPENVVFAITASSACARWR